MRIMSLDIGDRTVGIAVSDELLFTAQGVETIRRKSYKHDLARIRELSKQYETKKFVVGLQMCIRDRAMVFISSPYKN